MNLIQELLKDSARSYVNVKILFLNSLDRPSSKKLRKKAVLMSIQDVRDPSGNSLSQYEASPPSEYKKSFDITQITLSDLYSLK